MKTSTSLNGLVIAALTVLTSPAALAGEDEDRIKQLEKRLEILEQKNKELEQMLARQEAKTAETPKPAEPPKPGPSLSVGSSGFALRSADTNFVLRLRGLLQLDSRWSDDDAIDDTFLVRRARPILEGTVFRDFDFRFTPEFAGSSTSLRDAWLNYRYHNSLELRVGKMKPPGGLERWQSAANTLFIERNVVSLLWPSRDVGVMLHGEFGTVGEDVAKALAAGGLVHYSAGIFNDTGDGGAAANRDFDGDKSAAGRLFFHPFLKTGWQPLRNLGFGVSGTYGEMEGAAGLPDDYDYADGVVADGTHWRVGPQAYWFWGPFGLLGEYGISSQRLEDGAVPLQSMIAANQAWAITASWLLTGEDATFRRPIPEQSFDPRVGGWGAWQLVVGYSYLDIDDDLFPNFANPDELATRSAAWSFGLNWYLNRNIRAAFNYTHADIKGGESGSVGDLGEHAFLTRLQVAF